MPRPAPTRRSRSRTAALRRGAAALLLLGTLALAGGAHAQTGPTSVQLILDASGSMFTRLPGGQTRIAAAQDVLSDLIAALPDRPDLNVGLRLYGARTNAGDAGACQDSALTIPMTGVDRAALLNTVRTTRPRGATPIVYALTQAARDFPATPGRKLVVLVTDGLESCGGNLQDALKAFRERGIEVDLRVIGIDLNDRAAQAFAGVGTFVNTRSAPELAAALGQATAQVAPPATQTLPVTVTLTSGGNPVTSGPTVTLTGTGGRATSLSPAGGAYAASVPPGAYTATVSTATDTRTFAGLTVSAGSPNRFTFDLTPTGRVTLTVTPAAPTAGGRATISFSGAPTATGRPWITLARPGDPDPTYLDWEYVTGASGTVTLTVPDDTAPHEARYHQANPDGSTRVIGRSAPFTPQRTAASVTAPATAAAGSAIRVNWTGPNNPGDYVTIVPASADPGAYTRYFYTTGTNPGTLTTPPTPGAYEVRLNNETSGRVLARAPITLTASAYAVTAPTTATAGSRIQVGWTGPNNPGDYVTIVPRGAPVGAYLAYFYTKDGNPGPLTTPPAPGEYEIRYSTEAATPNPTLASTPIRLTAAAYSLSAPRQGKAGTTIQVNWTGPNNPGDYVTIVPRGAPVGAYLDYFYTRDGNPGALTLPDQPGEYEIRYSTEAATPNPTLHSIPFTVTK
ncbi:VWA domain-containing protein [Deinococcus sp. ME38]|uniref:vWA domain-containing protein n=1 Tax=Deinococcus sp. ME38 TaxID=3400344 RepID=UPI003B59AD49